MVRARRLASLSRVSSPLLGSLSAIAIAFFPKCPMCWAAYLSLFGVAGVEWLSESAWLLPALVLVLVLNVGCLWWIAKRSRRKLGFYLAGTGSLVIVASGLWLDLALVRWLGIALVALGSLACVAPLKLTALGAHPSRARRVLRGLTSTSGPTR
mgnify:CR=1 FL=1